MVHKVPRNLEFADEEKFTTATNHNYFMRTTVVTIVKLILASLIVAFATGLLVFVCSLIVNASESGGGVTTGIFAFLIIVMYIAYGVYFCNQLEGLIKLHKEISAIEDSVFELYDEDDAEVIEEEDDEAETYEPESESDSENSKEDEEEF